ncbi:MAG: hypothetical protein ACW967_09700, partial [Candidatus Hodarchaeales archaeon]
DNVEINWLASILIVIAMLIIRFYSIDPNKLNDIIQGTNPVEGSQFSSNRFLNWMVIAMIVGLIATFTIRYDFIAGMLVYLIMQISLIIAFSGIFHYHPSKIFQNSNLRNVAILSLGFWIIAIGVIFFVFVYGSSDANIVIPYVTTIGIMATYSWFGLGYSQRSWIFRLMLIVASGLFVFSDSLIGNENYGQIPLTDLFFLINPTYVLNIFLMSQAVLFLKDHTGKSPLVS